MKKQRKLPQALFAAVAVIGLMGTFSGTARADDDGWRYHERYEHQRYAREDYNHEDYDRDAHWHYERHAEYRHYYYDRDGRLVVYYNDVRPTLFEPRPVAEPSGFNIVIPLDIR